MPRSTTWWPFGRCGSSSRVAFCGGVAKSSSPPISSVSTFESRTCVYLFSSGFAGHASTQPAAGPDEVGAGAADDRPAVGVGREEAPGGGGVAPADRGDVAPDLLARERDLRHQRQEPGAARRRRCRRRAACRSSSAPASGPAPSVVAFIRPKNAAALTLPCLIGRNQQWSGMSLVRRVERRREVGRPALAGRVLRAERGVAADLLVGRLRVPEEVAGRVDADHHRAVDAASGSARRRSSPCASRRSR